MSRGRREPRRRRRGGRGARKGAKEKLRGWFTGRLPVDWFTAAPDIQVDREE
jgi:hypothetical protein